VALIALSVWLRVYFQVIPRGLRWDSFIPFTSATVDGGQIKSPNGITYRIWFNDAGGMHSGNHWTYIVGYDSLTGKRLVLEGYLGAEYAVDGEEVPVSWDGELPVVAFRSGRYE
jgi:hypothetical protein